MKQWRIEVFNKAGFPDVQGASVLTDIKEFGIGAVEAVKFARSLGYENFSFEQAMSLFYQPSPNAPTPQQVQDEQPDSGTNKTPKQNETRKDSSRPGQ